MVVNAAKRKTTKRPAAGKKPVPQKRATRTKRQAPPKKKVASRKPAAKKRNDKSAARAKPVARMAAASPKKVTPPKVVYWSGRVAAPQVRLGMTPPEVRETTGRPECIIFGSDDHVEWQFGARGLDAVGAPTLYVTSLTFASGRVVRITERMSEALD